MKLLLSTLLILLSLICGHQSSSSAAKIIDCGIDYLDITIGLSMVDNKIYQILLENNTIKIIIYENKEKRLKLRTTEIENNNDDSQEFDKFYYQLNLLDGYYNDFDEIIKSKLVRSRIIETFHYKHSDDGKLIRNNNIFYKHINAIITNDNNMGITFITYETSYQTNHFIAFCYENMSEDRIQLTVYNPKQPAEMIIVSDGKQFIQITYKWDDDCIKIGTFNEKQYKSYYLYLKLTNPLKFYSSSFERYTDIEPEQSEHSRQKIRQIFIQYQFRYGFIQLCNITNHPLYLYNKSEKILFLFSNQRKHVLSINIGDIFSNVKYISYEQLSYEQFFKCKHSSTTDDKVITKPHHKKTTTTTTIGTTTDDDYYESTTTTEQPTSKSLSLIYLIFIISSILIICPLIAIIIMISYKNGCCRYNICFCCCCCCRRRKSKSQQQQKQEKEQRKLQRIKKLQKIKNPYEFGNIISEVFDSMMMDSNVSSILSTTPTTKAPTSTLIPPKRTKPNTKYKLRK